MTVLSLWFYLLNKVRMLVIIWNPINIKTQPTPLRAQVRRVLAECSASKISCNSENKQTKKTLRWRMKIPKFGQLLIGLIKLLIDDLKMPSLFLKPVLVWQLSPKEESTFRCRYVLLFENIFIYLCTHFSRVEKLQCIPRFCVIMGQCSSLLSGNNADLLEKQRQSFFFLGSVRMRKFYMLSLVFLRGGSLVIGYSSDYFSTFRGSPSPEPGFPLSPA